MRPVKRKMNVWESRFFLPLTEAARLPKDNPMTLHPIYFLVTGLSVFLLMAIAIAAMLVYR